MRQAKEDLSHRTGEAIDLISAVKDLHQIPSQELGKLLADSEKFTLKHCTEKVSPVQIDVEKLVRLLPLHLIAVLISSNRDEALLGYMLRGFRVLHSLTDLAGRHTKLEQILLDDVKVSEQLLDLIFHMLIVLSNCRKENQVTGNAPLIRSALVICSLHLLTLCISPQWHELVPVLLAHPKADTFMDAAFRAVYLNIKYLQLMLSDQNMHFFPKSNPTAEKKVSYLCQQCEASLQFLQTLCQQKMFRERLIRNKELRGKGGVLLLAKTILNLTIGPFYVKCPTVVAAVSRIKSKVLSILLHLCEVENISFLDEAFSTPKSQELAKFVASQVRQLLRTALNNDSRQLSVQPSRTYPMGLLQLNALRLADIFSDDSNFKSHMAVNFTEVVTTIFLIPQGEFLSTWCSSSPQLKEEDASLEYDAFTSAGWILDSISSPDNVTNPEFSFIFNNMPQASYALHRTSLLVKVIANLHCFVPEICKEHEKNLFLTKFIECFQMAQPKVVAESSLTSDAQRAATICKNMRSLLSHSESLIPIFLNEEDVHLFRIFFNQLQSLISPDQEEDRFRGINFDASASWDKFSAPNFKEHHEEAHSNEEGSSPLPGKVAPQHKTICSNLKEEISDNSGFQEVDQTCVRGDRTDQVDDVMKQDTRKDKCKETGKVFQNMESSGSDSSSARGKNYVDRMDYSEYPQSNEHNLETEFERVQEDEKAQNMQCEAKQQRKRKRTLMNDEQMTAIETALVEEPGMQRNSASLQLWADKLSNYGPEVTSSQLKNWLNNRKARLARAAAKDVRAVSETDHAFPDKQGGGSGVGSPDIDGSPSPDDKSFVPIYTRPITQSTSRSDTSENVQNTPPVREPGHYVIFLDGQGREVGKGNVYQGIGKWYGMSLEDSGTCVLDVSVLNVKRCSRVPYPSEATGNSFDEAESKVGKMRVLWDVERTRDSDPVRE